MDEDLDHVDSEEGSEEEQSDDDSEEDWVEDMGTKQAYRKDLHRALTSMERPGHFCTKGTLHKFGMPGLEVLKLGPIRLPLATSQAEELARLCSEVPPGKRDPAVNDPSVRRCLQLPPNRFHLQGPRWAAQVQSLANGSVKRGLGLPQYVTVVPQLSKLLLYEPGCFCAPERNVEKKKGVFGTLAIELPSKHQGGELVVRHAGRETVHGYGARSMYQLHYSAFYANCECEVRPVKSGYRLVLVYDLKPIGCAAKNLAPADNRKEVTAALAAFRAWSEDGSESPMKLVIPLKHDYSSKSLSFGALKGVDRGAVDVLRQAAKVPNQTPFHFYLGNMRKHLEPKDPDFREQDDEYRLELANMVTPAGENTCYYNLKCDEEELEEYGWSDERAISTRRRRTAIQRWDGRAAIIVWPHSLHWDIACTNDIGAAIEEAAEIGASAIAVRDALEESASGQRSPGDAALLVDLVVEHGHVAALEELQLALRTICKHGKKVTPADGDALAQLLIDYGSLELVKAFLLNHTSPGDGAAIRSLASHFGWATLEDDVTALIERLRATDHLADCFKLLLGLLPEGSEPPPGAIDNVSVETGVANRERAMSEASDAPKKRQKRGGKTERVGMRGATGTAKRPQAGSRGVRCIRTSVSRRRNVSFGVAGAGSKKLTGKLTTEELLREKLCRRWIAAIVEKVSQPKSRPSFMFWLGRDDLGEIMPLLVRLIERFGFECVAPATKLLIRAKVTFPVSDAAGLLWAFVDKWGYAIRGPSSPPDLSPAALVLCRQFADELTAHFLQTEDAPRTAWSLPNNVSLAVFLGVLCCLDADRELVRSVVAKAVASPHTYPSVETVVPAFEELVDFFGNGPPRASCLADLLWEAVTGLENRWPGGPPEAKNWALPAQCGCSCELCKSLVEFCQHATQIEKYFGAATPNEEHMRESVKKYNMPLKFEREAGSFGPVPNNTLVCIKEGLTGPGAGYALQRKEQVDKLKYEDDKSAIIRLLELGSQLEVDPPNTGFDFQGKRSAWS